MLVLSRKAGERIHIGDQITLEVRRIAGNRVTLALRAPRTIRILRGELEKIASEFETVEFEPVLVESRELDANGTSTDAEATPPVVVTNDPVVQVGFCVDSDSA